MEYNDVYKNPGTAARQYSALIQLHLVEAGLFDLDYSDQLIGWPQPRQYRLIRASKQQFQ